jgi:hypothetical protein
MSRGRNSFSEVVLGLYRIGTSQKQVAPKAPQDASKLDS